MPREKRRLSLDDIPDETPESYGVRAGLHNPHGESPDEMHRFTMSWSKTLENRVRNALTKLGRSVRKDKAGLIRDAVLEYLEKRNL